MCPDEPGWANIAGAGGPAVAYRSVSPTGADDTANIKAAIAAVIAAGQANGSNYGEVWFDATLGPFTVNGALTQGGATLGNAQIPLPVISSTGPKFTLILRGVQEASALPHWQQTSQQRTGATLITNLNAGFDSTYGSASCIGGPTPKQLGATDGGFSNMLVAVDGLTIINSGDVPGVLIDLAAIAQCRVGTLALNGNVTPGSGTVAKPIAGGLAFRAPGALNNDNCEIDSISIEGFTYALAISEHAHIRSARVIYCQYGVLPNANNVTNTDYSDCARIDYLSTEICQYHISTSFVGTSQTRVHLDVGTWDTEDANSGITTTYHVDDAQNYLEGDLGFHNNSQARGRGAVPLVNGAANARIINTYQARGHVAPPAVPATTVALVNPFWRDAAVTITGGTVTAIAVDGTATGLTSGTVIVPSGKTITLTYTAAPAWNWVLL